MDVDRYLRRIDSGPIAGIDSKTLRELHSAHLHAVPFENLDIGSGTPLALDEEALFDKIVVRRRGGICYELNILFAALLGAIGFRVTLVAAEVCKEGDTFGPPFDHMALLVDIGTRRFLADVGFGDSFLEPLDLDCRGEQPQGNGIYEVRRLGDDHVVISRQESAFRFKAVSRQVSDFGAMCVFHQTSRDSHFTQKDICSRAAPGGRLTISGDQLIVTRGDSKSVTDLRDAAEKTRALRAHFGIVL